MTWRISIESENHLPLENVEYRLTKHPLTGCLLSSYKATYNFNLYSAWSEGFYLGSKKNNPSTKPKTLRGCRFSAQLGDARRRKSLSRSASHFCSSRTWSRFCAGIRPAVLEAARRGPNPTPGRSHHVFFFAS